MKKILLALMITVSVSFADYSLVFSNQTSTEVSWPYGNCTVSSSNDTNGQILFSSDTLGYSKSTVCDSLYHSVTTTKYYNVIYSSCPTGYARNSTTGICELSIPTCTSDEKLDTATNTCVPKTVDPNNPNCNPVASQFTNFSTGKCEDCMAFTSFSSRASCACNAYGSTYTPTKGVAYYYTLGQYTYKKQRVKCDDGVSETYIYYDPLNNNPQDYNSTTPSDSNNTSPTDNNTTTTDGNTSTPSQSDVVNAVKDSSDKTIKAINETNTAIKSVDTSVQAVNTTLQASNFKLDSMVSKLSDSNALLSDSKNIQSDVKNILSSEFKETKAFREHLDARFKNLIDISLANGSQLNDISAHSAATANAVNAQGDKIAGKLDDILNAIKDGNGTDMTATNDLLEKINKDTNSTASGVSTLHDDLNTSIELLNNISTAFENNNSFRVPDVNESKFELSDLLPDNNWFETNKLKLNFKNYSGGCYCQTFDFKVAGRTFIIPPQEALDAIPFDVIAKMIMAFIYVLGLRDFLKP